MVWWTLLRAPPTHDMECIIRALLLTCTLRIMERATFQTGPCHPETQKRKRCPQIMQRPAQQAHTIRTANAFTFPEASTVNKRTRTSYRTVSRAWSVLTNAYKYLPRHAVPQGRLECSSTQHQQQQLEDQRGGDQQTIPPQQLEPTMAWIGRARNRRFPSLADRPASSSRLERSRPARPA